MWLQVNSSPSEYSTLARDSLNSGALPTQHPLAWGDHEVWLAVLPQLWTLPQPCCRGVPGSRALCQGRCKDRRVPVPLGAQTVLVPDSYAASSPCLPWEKEVLVKQFVLSPGLCGDSVLSTGGWEAGNLEMTGLALPLLQCCRGRSVSFQTREHLMWSITLSWRASAQSLETPCCRATSVSHWKRGRVHLSLVPDLSTAPHPLTLQQQQAPSRAHPRVTLCQQQFWCHGNPRIRSGGSTLTEFSSSSTMPTRCDQSCLLLLGMVLGIPWGRHRAALTDYLSKQFLLNILLIASN